VGFVTGLTASGVAMVAAAGWLAARGGELTFQARPGDGSDGDANGSGR
jgi:hypothetical protein